MNLAGVVGRIRNNMSVVMVGGSLYALPTIRAIATVRVVATIRAVGSNVLNYAFINYTYSQENFKKLSPLKSPSMIYKKHVNVLDNSRIILFQSSV